MQYCKISAGVCTGCGKCLKQNLKCPICGEELYEEDTVFLSESGEIVGCEECIITKCASDAMDSEDIWRKENDFF